MDPLPGEYAGVTVRFDGPETAGSHAAHRSRDEPGVARRAEQRLLFARGGARIGSASFTPDNGVLLAVNKDGVRGRSGRNGGPSEFDRFTWVIDTHPEDMNRIDCIRPNGDTVTRTAADDRPLNDALLHAGLDSGSEFEWRDEPNRLAGGTVMCVRT